MITNVTYYKKRDRYWMNNGHWIWQCEHNTWPCKYSFVSAEVRKLCNHQNLGQILVLSLCGFSKKVLLMTWHIRSFLVMRLLIQIGLETLRITLHTLESHEKNEQIKRPNKSKKRFVYLHFTLKLIHLCPMKCTCVSTHTYTCEVDSVCFM